MELRGGARREQGCRGGAWGGSGAKRGGAGLFLTARLVLARRSGGSYLAAAGRAQGSRLGLLSLPAAMERLTLPPGGAEAVDEYLEYKR